MDKYFTINQRIQKLRGVISLLEWDLPNIKNSDLKNVKERKLIESKRELDRLMSEYVSINTSS